MRVNSYNGPLLSVTNEEKLNNKSKRSYSSKNIRSFVENGNLQEQINEFKKSHDLLNEKHFLVGSDYKSTEKNK